MNNSINNKIKNTILVRLFIALSIAILMFMPKFVLSPFLFTVASYVPIYLAALISPPMASVVALGSALGFLFLGLPAYIAARAATHLVFVLIVSKLINSI